MPSFSNGEEMPRRAAFLSGLTTPSLLSTGLALLFGLFVFSSLFFLTERFVGSPLAAYAAQGSRDHPVFASSDVVRLRALPPEGQPPLLAIVGASVTRSSFGTEAEIEKAMLEATGQPVEVVILATGLQGLVEHISIIESLMTGRPTWFVLGLGPSRFCRTPEMIQEEILEPNLGFRSAEVRGYAEAAGLRPFESTGYFLLDNLSFWLARLPEILPNVVKGMPEQAETTWRDRRMSQEKLQRRFRNAASRYARLDANFEDNLELVDRLVERLEAHPEVDLTIVENAVNPVFLRDWMGEDFYATYLDRMRDWTEERQVDYLTLALDEGFADEDYFDWAHVSSPDAISRLRAGLVAHLAKEPLQ